MGQFTSLEISCPSFTEPAIAHESVRQTFMWILPRGAVVNIG